ncbi:glycoside hydrolase family 3 N-terminal domain-containing protein [Cellulomonas denverensis]|uniref:beta-glucosidase n=1 Tax=Cellulomonas denverensis TaxID=264297 RepID=A0A7X6KX93_9CELL|nr:glycoside hydrolase family 3 N-terminal domain-containing protein [Cellulomonas denverensis]NKY23773.1 glycoside hydrolase family 3 protein [Cellulomonas denverensis]GIG25734.1 beta-glucosidase [Cellulomonas denverensis]
MKTRTTTYAKGVAVVTGVALFALTACTSGDPEDQSSNSDSFTTREVSDGTTDFVVVTNPGDGPVLSYGADSGIELLTETEDGLEYAFKDMNGNGELDVWEDWRVAAEDRAADLAGQLSIEQIAGLMLFSSHERSPADGITDAQKEYMEQSRLRNVLNAGPNDVEANVTWSNQLQAFAESLATEDEPYVPVNFSSDPRSGAESGGDYNASGDISRWPSNLGLAATFDTETMTAFATAVSAEYRALGIGTALSPQIDLATDPRWLRVSGTFGENVELATEMAQAYVEGFQATPDAEGWGDESVNAMIKHWAGDGPGEGGRESHTEAGKYGVYPGDNFDAHAEVFLGAMDAAAVMTAYSIALDGEGQPLGGGDRMGSAYDSYRTDLLRQNFSGVVVTDWAVTAGGSTDPEAMIGTSWGADDLTVAERHYEILQNGVDMFGGNNAVEPVLEAYDMWQADFEAGNTDVDADTRFAESGTRILAMLFQPGLYENAYLDLDESQEIVASQDKMDAGYQAQLDSVVMLKNEDGTIAAAEAGDWSDKTVYIPRNYDTGQAGLFGPGEYTEGEGLTAEIAEEYFGTVVTDEAETDADGQVISYTAPDLSDVDLVLVGMDSPNSGAVFANSGHDEETGEWYPLSLQYRPYTADGENVRQVSISGDLLPDGTQENRSYYGNTSRVSNESDLDAFERAVAAVEASGKDIPVITVLRANNPTVPAEFEARSDAILVGFGVSDQALIETAIGLNEPQGRLPIAFPASMDAVEKQLEDVQEDTEPYVDSAGNSYLFGFGLNYSGPISD